MSAPFIKPEHRGLLHEKLGIPQGEKIPAPAIAKAEHSSSPALRTEAHFADNFVHGGSIAKGTEGTESKPAVSTPKPNSSKPRVARTRPEPRRALAIPMVKSPAVPNHPGAGTSSDDSESPGVSSDGNSSNSPSSSYVPGLDDDEDGPSITRGLFRSIRGR